MFDFSLSPLAYILFLISLALFGGIFSNLARRALRGTVKLYETKNFSFFSVAFMLLVLGVYVVTSNSIFLLIAPLPMVILMIWTIIKKKRKSKNAET